MISLIFDYKKLRALTAETQRDIRAVKSAAKIESRLIQRIRRRFFFKAFLLAMVLTFDYFVGVSFMSTLLNSTSHVSVWVVGLLVPIAVIATHFLILEGQEQVRKSIRFYAIIGALVLPIAMSLGLAISMASNAIYDSGSTFSGTIGGSSADFSSSASSNGFTDLILGVLGGLSPLLLAIALAMALGISTYIAHRLLSALEVAQEKLSTLRPRKQQIDRICSDIQKRSKLISEEGFYHEALRRKIPLSLEEKFADTLYVEISKELRQMRQFAEQQFHSQVLRDSWGDSLDRKLVIPSHISDMETAHRVMNEIRDKLRPHAVMSILRNPSVEWE